MGIPTILDDTKLIEALDERLSARAQHAVMAAAAERLDCELRKMPGLRLYGVGVRDSGKLVVYCYGPRVVVDSLPREFEGYAVMYVRDRVSP